MWHYAIGFEMVRPEDISDLERALNPPEQLISQKVGTNAPCPCGAGRNTKNAVMQSEQRVRHRYRRRRCRLEHSVVNILNLQLNTLIPVFTPLLLTGQTRRPFGKMSHRRTRQNRLKRAAARGRSKIAWCLKQHVLAQVQKTWSDTASRSR